MPLAFLFHYLLLNMFRMLIHPSSGVLRLICWVISWVVLLWFDACWCYVVVWLGWCGIQMQAEALFVVVLQPASNQSNTIHEITQQISRKLLMMDVLTSETCWAVNNEIKKQVASSWSLFIQPEILALNRLIWNQFSSRNKTFALNNLVAASEVYGDYQMAYVH